MGYSEMKADARSEYGTDLQREEAERLRLERQAALDEANRKNELDRIERARLEKFGEVHFVAKVVIERVNFFPAKPGSGRGIADSTGPQRKVTVVEQFSLNGKNLDKLIQRSVDRLGLIEDDEIIDPVSKASTRTRGSIDEEDVY